MDRALLCLLQGEQCELQYCHRLFPDFWQLHCSHRQQLFLAFSHDKGRHTECGHHQFPFCCAQAMRKCGWRGLSSGEARQGVWSTLLSATGWCHGCSSSVGSYQFWHLGHLKLQNSHGIGILLHRKEESYLNKFCICNRKHVGITTVSVQLWEKTEILRNS